MRKSFRHAVGSVVKIESLETRQLLSGSPFLVKDIFPGASDSRVQKITAAGGLVFFVASPQSDDRQLFRSDGTANGTIQLTQVVEAGGPNPYALTNVNGTLFFAANDPNTGTELWKSDGTVAGTVMIKDIYTGDGTLGTFSSNPHGLVAYKNDLYFVADDGDSEQIWKSDGTTAGTVKVTSISPGMPTSFDDLTVQGNTLYFFGDDVTHGPGLWKSDGTAAGTSLVQVTGTVAGGGGVGQLTPATNQLFYVAYDPTNGYQVWRSDGTPGGTHVVKVIDPGETESILGPTGLTTIGNIAYFAASDGTSRQFWRSDGTDGGTAIVKVINPGFNANPTGFTNINGTLYFSAENDSAGLDLWSSDGTSGGTNLLTDINPGASSSNPSGLINVNGTLFFNADDGTHGTQLWERTPTTTQMLPVINASGDSFDNNDGLNLMAAANGLLFFNATDGTNGEELWAYQAFTPALNSTATTVVCDQNPAGAGAALNITAKVISTGTPTGNVQFFDGSTSLGMVALSTDGLATLTVATLAVGDRTISAQYVGDNTFAASSSVAVTETIANLTATTTAVVPSINPALLGNSVSFTATVTGAGATGNVAFFDGSTQIGTIALASGTATFNTTTLAAGDHSITAQYPGDSNFASSTSPAIVETVNTTPPSDLVPDLTAGAGIIPANVVAGIKLKKAVPVTITNPTGAMIKGSVTIVLYASSSSSSIAGATPLATVVKKVALKASKALKLKIVIPTFPTTVAAGTYSVVAQLTDFSNLTRLAALPGTVTVAAPFILPLVTVGAVAPVSITAGKHGSITLTIANNGNIDAVGTITIQVAASTDGLTAIAGTPLISTSKKIKIKHGGGTKIKLRVTIPVGQTAGQYFPLATVTLNGVTATAVGPAYSVA